MVKNENIRIIGILVTKQVDNIATIQDLLTTYGCCIRTRLGLHNPVDNPNVTGLLILELFGEKDQMDAFEKDLFNIKGIQVQAIQF